LAILLAFATGIGILCHALFRKQPKEYTTRGDSLRKNIRFIIIALFSNAMTGAMVPDR
jgi:hypothetical protein